MAKASQNFWTRNMFFFLQGGEQTQQPEHFSLNYNWERLNEFCYPASSWHPLKKKRFHPDFAIIQKVWTLTLNMDKASLQYTNISDSRGPEISTFVMHSRFVCCNTERQEVVAEPQEQEIVVPQRFCGNFNLLIVKL